ncbi:hypothetical protein JYU34_000176 [Plutella xylostella]|uniref:HRDC domain-containing protein n=1 Tax=Plutella xylostella TaxID=51655 RepID=A0ABQ7R781_PLUXY|nr:hypothetical protein JYU34_000176 [Plutella xylostella]
MFSILNPEAPEFYPHLKAVTQNGFKTVSKSIQASNLLPSGQGYENFKTFTDFNILTRQLGNNVVQQSNRIIATEDQFVLFKNEDTEHNIETLIDANDTIIDRLDSNLDVASGISKFKFAEPSIASPQTADLTRVAPWNVSPVITKIKMGSATLIGAKNIPRPQIHFKDTIDNSESLWVPKISDKPNNIKPLALNILYNDNGEAVGYEHPYKVELDLYHPKAELLEASAAPAFPPPLEDTPLTYIDQEQQMDQLCHHLLTVKEIAVDLEHHSYRTYQGITCLIQLTTEEGGDFIIDALACREHIHKLNQAFTDPRILKVFHGAEMDIIWLQRDFGVYVVGLFDTYQAAKALQLSGLSLKNLLMRYCKVDADKKYQLADWRIRPLPEELMAYARVDTHYLLYMWRVMRNELLKQGTPLLMSVFEQSRQICGSTYNKEVCHDESHLSLLQKSRRQFNSRQTAALKLLYKWRDSQARALDESTAYLLPNHMLLALAEALPREVQGVHACCSPMPPFVKQNCITLHRMILTCRELPLEPQLYRMPASINAVLNHAGDRAGPAAPAMHDHTQDPDFRDDLPVALTMEEAFLVDPNAVSQFTTDLKLFVPYYDDCGSYRFVSELNAEAKSFIPPFERYKRYRTLAQIEELKEFKEKEAKLAALGKGNELIKTEVLSKLVEPQVVPVAEKPTKQENDAQDTADQSESIKTGQRKRKISNETVEAKNEETDNNVKNKTDKQNQSKPKAPPQKDVKKFDYKNADYQKFFNDSEKMKQKFTKQSKPRFKKHKK